MNNSTLLYEGGVVDGIWYPPLDEISLLAFPYGQSTDDIDELQIDSSVALAAAMKKARDKGVVVPPAQVMTQLTISDKGKLPSAGEICTEDTVKSKLIGRFKGTDISSWQFIIFNWAKPISNTFPLHRADWSALSDAQKAQANAAWDSIWNPIRTELGEASLPRYLPTAEETLTQLNFTSDTTTREAWWAAYRQFFGERFIQAASEAAVE